MIERNFREMLKAKWDDNRFVCVGLDSDFSKISYEVRKELRERTPMILGLRDTTILSSEEIMFNFNRAIVDATKDIVCAYKPNIAFYEAQGIEGLSALIQTTDYIRVNAPDVPIILDAKRADIGNTNQGYVEAAFKIYGADAITVHPYLGREALQPFLDQKDKGIFVLVRTSNPGAGEFQDISDLFGQPLHQIVARHVAERWNENHNCGIVVGATYPEELKTLRLLVGNMPILIPGIGKQGGDIEKTVNAGKDSRGKGMIINSSRGIIFASQKTDFDKVARRKTLELHQMIKKYL